MMSLPFFGFFVSLACVFAGKRTASIVLFAISLGVMLVLFKLHATDPLAVSL